MEEKDYIKIELGGGQNPYGHGFLNVDTRPLPTVDIQCDLKDLIFADCSVGEVFSSNALEHFKLLDVEMVLKEAFRVLKPKGTITIVIPDFKSVLDSYIQGNIDFRTFNLYLYGAQRYSYDVHRVFLDFNHLKMMLESAGFEDIKPQPYDLEKRADNCPMLKVKAQKRESQCYENKGDLVMKGDSKVIRKDIMGYYQEIEGNVKGNLERVVPHSSPDDKYIFHLSRYRFAATFLRGKSVIDIGCGSGYGSFLLAQDAKEVLGIDYAQEVIKFAQEHFCRDNLEFQSLDWKGLGGLNKLFDGIIALEFLEHIDDQKNFLGLIKKLLKNGGTFILSTPNRNLSLGNNPFHMKEHNPAELKELLSGYFSRCVFYGQFLKPECKIRLQNAQKLQRYLEGHVLRILIPKFIRNIISLRAKEIFWEKFRRNAALLDTERNKVQNPKLVSLDKLISISPEDILITSSYNDIWAADYLLAVCRNE